MSKFLINLLGQISKVFVYSKIQILFGNNSPHLLAHPAFWPSRGPFFFFSNRPIFPPLPTGPQPPGRPSPPSRPNRPPVIFLPHRSRARTVPPPAGLAPPPWSPRRLHRKRKTAASNYPSFSPSSILETGAFNPAIEASHASDAPSLNPHRALVVAHPSRSFRRR
jgi:hypothetical protein